MTFKGTGVMVGFTHQDMGQLYRSSGASYDRYVALRSFSNVGEVNNFTSYDLAALGYARDELVYGGPWFAYVYDRTAGRTGQIEYAQMQVTMHTRPNRADTDADGLNDSEEINLASDGFQTNPWTADTDADGLADGLEANGWSRSESAIVSNPNGFKTDPTRADTDHDGVADNRDYVPLGDAFITVRIVSATVYGGADDDPTPNTLEPFVEVSDGSAWAYTAYASAASGGTASYTHTYSANVADDQRYVNVYFWVNDYDPDDVHEAFALNGTATWASASHDLSQGVGYTSYLDFTGTGSLRVAPLRVQITTVVPDRIDARFVLPADYAGVYNVTNAAGSIIGRRYVGEPRFVALALNVTTPASWQCLISGGCDDSKVEPKVLLLPRSVFFESRLYAKLAARDLSGLPAGLAFRQNDTSAASNSDGLQEILSGNVTSSEYLTVLDLLLRNATNAYAHRTLNLTNDLFLYGLPAEAVRLVGYKPLPSTPSTLYRFCPTANCAASPVDKPIWEQIWEGIVSTVTGWIVSAVVMAYNAFRMIVEILAQVGNWLAQAVSTAAQAVASAVQAAAKVVEQFVDWIVNLAVTTLTNAISGLLNTVKLVFDNTIGRFVQELEAALAGVDLNDVADRVASLLELLSVIVLAIAMVPVAIRVASIAIKAMTVGVSWLVETAISEGVAQFIVRVLMGIAFSLATTALFTAILDTIGWVEDTTVAFFRTLGIAATAIYAVSKVVFKLYESLFVKTATDVPIVQRYKGFALAVLGLLLVFIGSSTYAQSGTGRLAADLAGFAFQAYGFWLFIRSSKDPLVQVGDFVAPIGSAIEHGVAVLAPPVSAAKITYTWTTGGYS